MNSSVEVTRDDVERLYGLAFSKQMEKTAQFKETGIGALGGAGLGALLGYLTPRDKDEGKVGRYLRYILGGAAMGGLAGLGYGTYRNGLFNTTSGASESESVGDAPNTEVAEKPSRSLEERASDLGDDVTNFFRGKSGDKALLSLERGLGGRVGGWAAAKAPRAVQALGENSIFGTTSNVGTRKSIKVPGSSSEINEFAAGSKSMRTATTRELDAMIEPGKKIVRLSDASKTGKKGLAFLAEAERTGAISAAQAARIAKDSLSPNPAVASAARKEIKQLESSAKTARRVVDRVRKASDVKKMTASGRGVLRGLARNARLVGRIFGGLGAISPWLESDGRGVEDMGRH